MELTGRKTMNSWGASNASAGSPQTRHIEGHQFPADSSLLHDLPSQLRSRCSQSFTHVH